MESADITFVILTKDEAAHIGACLGSLPRDARALVYDALSSDATVEIARSLGASIVQAPWQGFVHAREAAAALVQTPWTFMLDADELVTPDLEAELVSIEPRAEVDGYSVPRRNHFCGRWVRSGGWWPDRLVRLFRTGRARLVARGESQHGVHETWEPQGACVELRSAIDHYSYDSIASYRRKFALYSALEARGRKPNLGRVIATWLMVPIRFGWYWIRRGGILEGWRGAFVCAGNATYPAVVASKSWTGRTPSIER